jgi:HlyD family secretion protein
MVNRSLIILLLLVFGGWATACNNDEGSDAYGQFEAEEVRISAEVGGRLLSFNAEEGKTITKGLKVAQIDTMSLALQKAELHASSKTIRANITTIDAQIAVIKEQLKTAQKELVRIKNLIAKEAATTQQLDDITGKISVLNRQVEAQEAQKQVVRSELEKIEARRALIQDQIDKASIINPQQGIVLQEFVDENELIRQGMPLYEMANLDELELRVYISGNQLSSVKLGNSVTVLTDSEDGSLDEHAGEVSWISSSAEFTPKMIQTREERVTQVYAVKIRVPNTEGKLKIGMPGEVRF